jgi:hypothetical protein
VPSTAGEYVGPPDDEDGDGDEEVGEVSGVLFPGGVLSLEADSSSSTAEAASLTAESAADVSEDEDLGLEPQATSPNTTTTHKRIALFAN